MNETLPRRLPRNRPRLCLALALTALSAPVASEPPHADEILELLRGELPSGPADPVVLSSLLLRAEEALQEALSQAGSPSPLTHELAVFYDRWGWEEESFPDRLLELLQQAEQPADLAAAVEERTSFLSRELVLDRLLVLWPSHPAILAQLADGPPLDRASVLGAALDQLRGGAAAAAPGLARHLVAARIAALTELHLTSEALATLASAMPEVQAAVLSGDHSVVEVEVAGLSAVLEPPDVRLALAEALLAEGRPERARVLLVELERGEDPDVERAALLRWVLDAPDGDPFSLLARSAGFESTGSAIEAGAPLRIAAELARREGYPAFERWFLQRLCHGLPRGRERSILELYAHLPPEVADHRQRLLAEVEAARARLRADLSALSGAWAVAPLWTCPSTALGGAVEPGTAGFAGRLPVEVLAPWRSDDPEWPGATPVCFACPPGGHLSRGLLPVVTSRRGARVVVLALGGSPHLSPRAPQREAYWLLLSDDDGLTWQGPWFAGLFPRRPFELRPDSARVRLEGERLTVEVGVWKGWTEPFDWGETPHPAAWALLTLPLDRIRADRDGDGLTDLSEELVATDPAAADTDGDDLSDSEDPLPGSIREAAAEEPAEVLAWAVGAILARQGEGLPEDCPAQPAAPDALPWQRPHGAERPLCGGRTVQLVAPAGSLEDQRPALRLVLRSEEDPALLDSYHREMLDLVFLELLVTDRAGTRGILAWEDPSGGGSLTMRRGAEGWVVEAETEAVRLARCGYPPW